MSYRNGFQRRSIEDADDYCSRCLVPLRIYSEAECTYHPAKVKILLGEYQVIKVMQTEEAIETCCDLESAIKQLPVALRTQAYLWVDTGGLPADWQVICTAIAVLLGWKEKK